MSVRHRMNILSGTGDDEITWDPKDRVEIAVARARFEKESGRGMLLYRMNAEGKTEERLDTFDPEAGQLLVVAPKAGG